MDELMGDSLTVLSYTVPPIKQTLRESGVRLEEFSPRAVDVDQSIDQPLLSNRELRKDSRVESTLTGFHHLPYLTYLAS